MCGDESITFFEHTESRWNDMKIQKQLQLLFYRDEEWEETDARQTKRTKVSGAAELSVTQYSRWFGAFYALKKNMSLII